MGGVGYRLHATPTAIRKADGADEVVVETHLHVREDALQLFGFADADERELFEQLLAVSGVGPKVALAIVSGYSPAELRRAIVREDAALFQTIPGIGKKTAQRVVLELKERIAPLAAVDEAPHLGRRRRAHGRARRARRARLLGGRGRAAASPETDPDLPPAERVRQALRAA